MKIKTELVRDDLPGLIRPGGTCVELGVGDGAFSEKILQNSYGHILYSIDRWTGERGHDGVEEGKARQRLRPYPKDASRPLSVVWKDDFEKALQILWDDRSHDVPFLDFVYLDGYSDEGNGGLKSLHEWGGLVRPGGIISGNDYDPEFPENMKSVDKYIQINRFPLFVTSEQKNPSWFTFKR